MKMYRYKIMAEVTEWVDNDIIEKWTAREIVVAENEYEAIDKFTGMMLKTYYGANYGVNYDMDIDDVRWKLLGPADVYVNVQMASSNLSVEETMTVEELIWQLENFYDPKAKIYLADCSGGVAQYGIITPDTLSMGGDME